MCGRRAPRTRMVQGVRLGAHPLATGRPASRCGHRRRSGEWRSTVGSGRVVELGPTAGRDVGGRGRRRRATATATASVSTTASRSPTRRRAGSPTACTDPRPSSTPAAFRVDRRRLARRRALRHRRSTSCTSGRSRREGTLDAAAGQLDRLAALGVTTVELMPVNAFPGDAQLGLRRRVPVGRAAVLRRTRRAWPASSMPPTPRAWLSCSTSSTTTSGRRAACMPAYGPYFTDAYRTPWGDGINVSEAGQRPRAPDVHRERLPLGRGLPRRRAAPRRRPVDRRPDRHRRSSRS